MSDAEDVSVYVRLSSFASPGRELVRDSALLHAAKVVRLQIQVQAISEAPSLPDSWTVSNTGVWSSLQSHQLLS